MSYGIYLYDIRTPKLKEHNMDQKETTHSRHTMKRHNQIKKLYLDDNGQVRILPEELTTFHKQALLELYEGLKTSKTANATELKNLTKFLEDNGVIQQSYIPKIKKLETHVKALEKESSWMQDNSPDEPYSHTLENDPIDNNSEYWKNSNAKTRRGADTHAFVADLKEILQEKESITDNDLVRIQALTFKAVRLSVKLREIDDAIALLKIVGTGQIESENCQIKQKTRIMRKFLLDITKYYALLEQFKPSEGSQYFRVESICDAINSGRFGNELKEDKTITHGPKSLKSIYQDYHRKMHEYYDVLS